VEFFSELIIQDFGIKKQYEEHNCSDTAFNQHLNLIYKKTQKLVEFLEERNNNKLFLKSNSDYWTSIQLLDAVRYVQTND
jgi:hypothetical protein